MMEVLPAAKPVHTSQQNRGKVPGMPWSLTSRRAEIMEQKMVPPAKLLVSPAHRDGQRRPACKKGIYAGQTLRTQRARNSSVPHNNAAIVHGGTGP